MTSDIRPKSRAILEAATRIFLMRGYMGTSMDAIAEAAPVSKATLYSHFRNKQDLFAAVIAGKCETLLCTLSRVQTATIDVEASLRLIATSFADLIYSEESLSLYRIIVAEHQTFPELSALVHRSGGQSVLGRLTEFFMELHEKKMLKIPDAETSAKLFIGMLRGDDHTRCLLGLRPPLSEAEKEKLVAAAVSLFVCGHAYDG